MKNRLISQIKPPLRAISSSGRALTRTQRSVADSGILWTPVRSCALIFEDERGAPLSPLLEQSEDRPRLGISG